MLWLELTMQQTNNCEHCCLSRRRGQSQHEMHTWTGVTVIQRNDPIPIQVVNTIHMAEIDIVCITVEGKAKVQDNTQKWQIHTHTVCK